MSKPWGAQTCLVGVVEFAVTPEMLTICNREDDLVTQTARQYGLNKIFIGYRVRESELKAENVFAGQRLTLKDDNRYRAMRVLCYDSRALSTMLANTDQLPNGLGPVAKFLPYQRYAICCMDFASRIYYPGSGDDTPLGLTNALPYAAFMRSMENTTKANIALYTSQLEKNKWTLGFRQRFLDIARTINEQQRAGRREPNQAPMEMDAHTRRKMKPKPKPRTGKKSTISSSKQRRRQPPV
jgi:hypothetical protein